MFDSGFGGLTVARALIDLLPAEHLVYFGDTARYPYGPRSSPEVRSFACEIGRWLAERFDPKLIVVACNTATAMALDDLAAEVDMGVVGVIEPGVRALTEVTVTNRIGVVGTVGTIASGSYQTAVAEIAPAAELSCAACPGFVEFVERGETDSEQVHVLAERLLAPICEAKVDSLLLGCTHYPFLARTISDVMGRDVVLVSSADETAFAIRRDLSEAAALRPEAAGPGTHRWISSGDTETFARLGRRLLGPELAAVEAHSWENADAPKTRKAAVSREAADAPGRDAAP